MHPDIVQRLEDKVDTLTEAVTKLVLFEERQTVQAAAIITLTTRQEATEQKLSMWINRGIGVWFVVTCLAALWKGNAPMSKASEAALSELHATLANTLKEALALRDEEGAPIASILSVARQFLKDNFITADASAKTGPLAGLAGLPEFDDENVVPIARKG